MKNSRFLIVLASAFCAAVATAKSGQHYESIFNFGDSLSDTGNLFAERPISLYGKRPYGRTFFNHPTGRPSDGRLIIDFIAEANGLPYLPPYLRLREEKSLNVTKIRQGVNFAVSAATAIDMKFFRDANVKNDLLLTNSSLNVQIDWFKKIKPSLCSTQQECREYFSKSLFFVGEIGGNDINYLLLGKGDITKVAHVVPLVVETITNATATLIEEGAKTLVVPGNLPVGCGVVYLAALPVKTGLLFDEYGCVKAVNLFAKFYNKKLNEGVEMLRRKYPDAKIIYADYYGAGLQVIKDPLKFGFSAGFQTACCGTKSELCGTPNATVCKDPSQYVNWDGVHLTEASYRHIASALLDGFASPAGILNTSSSSL